MGSQQWYALLNRASLSADVLALLNAGQLVQVEVRRRSGLALVHLELPRRLPAAARSEVEKWLAAVAFSDENIRVRIVMHLPAPASLPEAVAEAWLDVVMQAKASTPRLNGFLDTVTPQVVGDRVRLLLPSETVCAIVKGAQAALEEAIAHEVGQPVQVELSVVQQGPQVQAEATRPDPLAADDPWEALEALANTDSAPETAAAPVAATAEPDYLEAYKDQWMQRQKQATIKPDSGLGGGGAGAAPGENGLLKGKSISDVPPREISSITEEENKVCIEGEAFNIDVRDLRSGKMMVSFMVCDLLRVGGTDAHGLGDSLPCKLFYDPQKPDHVPVDKHIKAGTWVKVRGNVQLDKFSQELTLLVDDMQLGTRPDSRKDTYAGDKRVELHCHTLYSAMDAMNDPEAIVKKAIAWGHKGIAITDHGVVQAFPFASHVKLPDDFKLMYGCEFNLVEDGTPIIERCPQDLPIEEAEFVVLDIETTGFSPLGDDIIELGAVKYKGGVMGESFQRFVRPTKPIPLVVQELTHITPDMVSSAPEAKVALREFFDFVGDAIIVAHNASFDYGFLRHHRRKHLREEFTNPVLDTLMLARAAMPHLKRFGLANLCKELGVVNENHHRADADARTAALVMGKMFERIKSEHETIATVQDLNDHLAPHMKPEAMRPTHVTVLIQKQHGVKNLYKIISRSHLEYFNTSPRVPRTLLQEFRDGLLVSSGTDEGPLYKALLQGLTDEELDALVQDYDYLEIVPPSNLGYLLKEGQVNSKEQLNTLNRRIYACARRTGKLVVAVGDVHYSEPHQQVFRRILKGGIGFRDEHDVPLHLRTTTEMLEEFAFLGPEEAREVVIENPAKLMDLIDQVAPVPGKLFAPKLEGAVENVRDMSYAKAKRYYGDPLPEIIEQRLEKELKAIIGGGFAVVYYISHLLVRESNNRGYLVGSRGSVGSSFVAWALDITEVNALAPHYICTDCHHLEWFADGKTGSGFDLPNKNCPDCGKPLWKDGQDIPFETFMGFKGDKVPDIDLNFSGEVQTGIQEFSAQLLGGDKQVFKAGTVGTIADKTAFGMTKKWLEENNKPDVRQAHVEYLAQGIVGVKRSTGQHPGGMVVVPVGMEVEEVTPVQYPADDKESGVRTTHYDYHSFEQCLLKLDILGHDDPTSLRMLQDMTGIDVRTIPMNDQKVLRLFMEGGADALGLQPGQVEMDLGTIAVPEFGTNFVRRMLLETKPTNFSDLVRISGLSHGTDVWTNNAQELIAKGTCTLQTVIPTRDDIMVYLIYQGLEPATAFKIMESVRKGKGLAPEMEEVMQANNVPDWYIWSCKQIKYMFPKAHAAAYVMSSLRIAWFKVHHPAEYYATYFTVRAGTFDADLICKGAAAVQRHIDEIVAKGREASPKEKDSLIELELVMEAFGRGISFQRVDLYKSEATRFQVVAPMTLLCPFSSLNGLAEAAATSIVEARQGREFESVDDLKARAGLNKTTIEALQQHGCLRGMPETNQLVFF